MNSTNFGQLQNVISQHDFVATMKLNTRVIAERMGPPSREEVIRYIKTCRADDLLQVLDEVTIAVADVLGCATGCEDDRHKLLLQVQSEEQE